MNTEIDWLFQNKRCYTNEAEYAPLFGGYVKFFNHRFDTKIGEDKYAHFVAVTPEHQVRIYFDNKQVLSWRYERDKAWSGGDYFKEEIPAEWLDRFSDLWDFFETHPKGTVLNTQSLERLTEILLTLPAHAGEFYW